MKMGCLGLFLALGACEHQFEPFAPSDLAFSIYGNLEATVDTQWIRIRPLQASPETMERPIDAVVTLEELATGAIVRMSDSIFSFHPSRIGDISVSLHNFYTTMPMVPGRSYRLTATRSDGASASGTVLIPDIDPVVEMTHYEEVFVAPTIPVTPGARGRLFGIDHIGMVFGDADIPRECGYFAPIFREFLRVEAPRSEGDPHLVWLQGSAAPPAHSMTRPDCLPDRWDERRIIVIASGEPWRWSREPGVGLRELLIQDDAYNIEGGIGFLTGTNMRVLPFERCLAVDRVSCTVTYSDRSATFVGKVNDSCTGLHLAGANVRVLRSGGNAVRTAKTNASGFFRIHGIDPGEPHFLSLTYPGYFDYAAESLSFGEADVDTATFVMQKGICDRDS